MFEFFSSIDESSSIPTQTVFSQQRLDAWRPLFTPFVVVAICFSVGTAFVIIGAVFYGISARQFEADVRYDDVCGNSTNCSVTVTLDRDVESVFFLSYKLTNFFQNHQRYLWSRSYDQLRGEYVDYNGMSDCGRFRAVGDPANSSNWLLPCGAVALSFFNDTFRFARDDIQAKFNEFGISWRSDREKIFKELSNEYTDGQRWLNATFAGDQTNEHFIVWMRAAALPTFVKPYTKSVETLLPKGEYRIDINNSYPTALFGGEKHIVLSAISGIGSRNNALGIAYLAVGAVIDILGVVVAVMNLICPRRLGDANYLLAAYTDDF